MEKKVYCFMPKYASKALEKYEHLYPTQKLYSPHLPEPIQNGAKVQTMNHDKSEPLDKKKVVHIQLVVGTMLYYVRLLDIEILPTINDIAMQQSKATMKTLADVNMLLDYLATNPNITIMYRKSDMKFKIHSNVIYLSVPKSRS